VRYPEHNFQGSNYIIHEAARRWKSGKGIAKKVVAAKAVSKTKRR